MYFNDTHLAQMKLRFCPLKSLYFKSVRVQTEFCIFEDFNLKLYTVKFSTSIKKLVFFVSGY